jgi:hypothetical protein
MAASLLTSAVAMAALGTTPAHAQNATWLGANPGDTSFNTPGNWSSGSVPTGIASFGPGATVTDPNIFSPATNTLNQFQFLAGAPQYSVGVFGTLNLNNGGVTGNASGNRQNIVVLSGGTLNFNSSTAGDSSILYGNRGGAINFNNGSNAGSANFQNTGTITFNDTSNASSAGIENLAGGTVHFSGFSTASQANILNSGMLTFTSNSDAGTSTIMNFGTTTFADHASGNQATIGNNATLIFRASARAATLPSTTALCCSSMATARAASPPSPTLALALLSIFRAAPDPWVTTTSASARSRVRAISIWAEMRSRSAATT